VLPSTTNGLYDLVLLLEFDDETWWVSNGKVYRKVGEKAARPGRWNGTNERMHKYYRAQTNDKNLLKVRLRARVINYYHRYRGDSKSPGYSDYCLVKFMLYHPFTDWSDLLSVENETYRSYSEAFRTCKRMHTHPEDFYDDPEGEGSVSDSNSADEDLQEEADGSPLADFEAFARRRPGDDSAARGYLLDSLGSREMDLSYDWSTDIGRYDEVYREVWN
jgi:hypothetical protein